MADDFSSFFEKAQKKEGDDFSSFFETAKKGGKKPPPPAKPEFAEMPSMDIMGGFTGGTYQAPTKVPESVREFERREGPLGYAKEYGKGAIAGVAGLPAELTVNLPSNLLAIGSLPARGVTYGLEKAGLMTPERRQAGLENINKTAEALRFGYGVPEASKYMFGEPQGPVAKGMRTAGEALGIPSPLAITEGARLPIAAAKLVAKPFQKAAELVRTAKGTDARALAEEIRGATSELTLQTKAAQETAAANAAAEAERLRGISAQIANRDAVAAERAAQRAGLPPEAMADVREAALATARDRVREAERRAVQAGLNETEVAAHVADVERNVVKAEQEIAALEQRLLTSPQMRPEEFGSMVANATRKLAQDAIDAREKLSGFGAAIRSAGNELRVETSNIIGYLESTLKSVKDPSIRMTLETIKNELTNIVDKKQIASLSIAQADSARKMMDRIMRTKQVQYANGTVGDAADALRYVSEARKRLAKIAGEAYTPYKEALNKFRELSRPLDIVERKGPLRQIVDIDNMSQELLRGSADIAGRVIQRAREGHPVFTRLLEIDPNIRNGAAAYFNRELFGAGRVPNADTLRAFLQKNEGVLRQLNLYDDFRTIAAARQSGQRALDAVKTELTGAKVEAKTAQQALRETLGAVSEAERLRGGAVERLAAAQKQTVAPEKIATEPAKTAAQRQVEITKQIGKTEATQASASERARNLELKMTELAREDLKTVSSKAESIIKDMATKGELTPQQYDQLLQQIRMVDNAYGKTDEARKKVLKIVGALGVTGLGGAGVKSYLGNP